MKKQALITLGVLFAVVLSFFSPVSISAKPVGNLPSNVKFDPAKFSSYIHSKLDANTVGYAMVLYKDGKYLTSDAAGYSVLKKDVPDILGEGMSFRPETRMNIASVTKPITATAVLKALQVDTGVSLDSKVADFLPEHWVKGPGVKDLTFRDFMSQFTGMNDNGGSTSIGGLREWIKTGVTRPKTDYIYINGNLAIFRIALPYLKARNNATAINSLNALAKMDEKQFNKTISDNFVKIVQDTVFTPMGIKNVSMKDDNKYATRFYNKKNNAAGYKTGDWTEIGGGGGWFMSAYELATFMSNLRYNDNILASSTRKLMDDNFLGWETPNVFKNLQGKYGDYLGHGGLLKYNDDAESTKVGMVSMVVNYPGGIQGVILINSFGDYPSKDKLMADAFDQAVVPNPVKTN